MRFSAKLLLACVVLAPMAVGAQLPFDTDPGRSVRTRADLERLLAEYDAALASPAYSAGVKRAIEADAERVRGRLTNGDFRVGDRISVSIEGEANYPDTVVVEPGPMIPLAPFGDISLAGVLRSEITEHLTKELSRFIRDPVVRANGQMRLAILGAVGNPGFYTMPAETLLSEVLMMAGGPGPAAELDDLRIERAGQRLYREEEVRTAIREGLTLDQLNLQAGDQVFLPEDSGSFFSNTLAVMGALGTVGFLFFRLGLFR